MALCATPPTMPSFLGSTLRGYVHVLDVLTTVYSVYNSTEGQIVHVYVIIVVLCMWCDRTLM